MTYKLTMKLHNGKDDTFFSSVLFDSEDQARKTAITMLKINCVIEKIELTKIVNDKEIFVDSFSPK